MKPLSAVNYVSSTRKSEVTGWVRVRFFGAGGAFLGVIWRDRRDPYSLQLGARSWFPSTGVRSD
jgi:hypothetical protein